MIKGEQDPELVTKIRACACEMLDVAEILQASGSESIEGLHMTEQSLRRTAVQLFGYFPAVEQPKAPSFQLRAPHSSRAETRTSTAHSTANSACKMGPPW